MIIDRTIIQRQSSEMSALNDGCSVGGMCQSLIPYRQCDRLTVNRLHRNLSIGRVIADSPYIACMYESLVRVMGSNKWYDRGP